MRYAVFGAGSMGSLFAGRLAASGADVVLVGRGDHLDAVERDGLRVVGPDDEETRVPLATARDPGAVEAPTALVLCVKAYDTERALRDAAPLLGISTDVLTFQNGLGNAETVAGFVPEERVVVGTTSHGAYVPEPGAVRHAGVGETVLGRFFATNGARVESYADDLTAAGVETTVTDAPERAVWAKVLVNAGINPATALADVPNGALVDPDATARERAGDGSGSGGAGERVLDTAVREGVRVAAAEGVEFDPAVAVERTREVAERTASNASSMRQDLQRGRATEIEALNGEIARRGDAYGVETPVNRTLADLVRLATQGSGSDGRGRS